MKVRCIILSSSFCLLTAIPVVAAIRVDDPLTKRLFMQTKSIRVSLPIVSGAASESFEQSSLMLESKATPSVTDTEGENDIWKTIALDGVTVIADRKMIKRVAENQGKINFSFYIHVPKVLLDTRWKITLTPKVSLGDSIKSLSPFVIKGDEFKHLQEKQYSAYEEYASKLVSPNKYSKLYVDSASVQKDIQFQQNRYWKSAQKERDKLLSYEQWKLDFEQKRLEENVAIQVKRAKLKQQIFRKAVSRIYDATLAGRDTAGIYGFYSDLYEDAVASKRTYRLRDTLTVKDIPHKYKQLFAGGKRLEDLKNFNITQNDSSLFASTRLRQDKLVENDYILNNLDQIKRNMIKFPLEENLHKNVVLVDSNSVEYTYLYMGELPLVEGSKSVSLVLDGRIMAIDRSVWTNPEIDMLKFVISSLAELADVSMRPSDGPVELYAKGLKALSDRKYKQAVELLGSFSDMNAAIAYACDGQTLKAVSLLNELHPTATISYIKAVLYGRLKEYQEAADALLEACNKDVKLTYRALSDDEVRSVILSKFRGLDQELTRIQNKQ